MMSESGRIIQYVGQFCRSHALDERHKALLEIQRQRYQNPLMRMS
jgi:hypothetical protein